MLRIIARKLIFSKTLPALFLAVFVCLSLASQQCQAAGTLNQAEKLMRIATQYSKQGNPMMAVKFCDQAIQLRPNDLSLFYQRALIWGRGGFYTNAVKDLSLVIREDGQSTRRRFPAARKFRAECFAVLGQMQRAVDEYKALLQENPQSGKLWYYMAEILAVMKRTAWALQAADRGIATGSHWAVRLEKLKNNILLGQEIKLHRPFSN